MSKEKSILLTRLSDRPTEGESKSILNADEANTSYKAVNGASARQTFATPHQIDNISKGRPEPTEEKETIGAAELFQFATYFDKILMFIGTLGAIALGTTSPINVAILGEVINVFIVNSRNIGDSKSNNQTSEASKNLHDAILPYVYIFIGLGIGAFITGYFAVSCWQWAAERQLAMMRTKFFHSVLRQHIGWFDVHEAGEISTSFIEELSKIAEGIGDKMAIFMQWATTWLAAYIIAFISSWKLTLAVIAISPLLILAGAVVVRVSRKMSSEEVKAYAKAGAIAEQALGAIQTVQAYQGQEKEIAKYEENLSNALTGTSKKDLASCLGNSLIWFLLFIMLSVVIWFGTYLIQTDDLQPGKTIPVFFGVMLGSFSMANAMNNLESFSAARGAAVNVFKIISLVSKIDSFSNEGLRLDDIKGHIEFKNIKFSYPARPDVKILKDLNLKIESGEQIALVGPSGCGKSTIVQLLQRFYDPIDGTILIDDIDIKSLNLKWLRSNIGVVIQEPSLFDASIEENIRFGKLDATEEEITNAAKNANAHDFIMQLPEGYKTNVGERGAQLSGGQKQRISIARALVRNPKILLLDEATSALDQESEAVVQNALEKAGEGRTTITIAHRLGTIQNADKIIAIDEGEVIEQGTPNELREFKGLYYELVKTQSMNKKDADIYSEILDKDDFNIDKCVGRELFKKTCIRSSSEEIKENNVVARTTLNQEKYRVKPESDESNMGMKDLIRLNAPEWLLIFFGCIASLLVGTVQPFYSFLLSEFIKLFEIEDFNEQWTKANVIGGTLIGLAFISLAVRIVQSYCFSKSGARLTSRLRKLTFSSLVYQDMDFFDMPDNQVGSLTTKLASDAALVREASGSKIGQLVEAMSTLICALIISFVYGWKLTFAILSFMPWLIISGVIQGHAVAGVNKFDKKHSEKAGKICSEAVDSISTVISLGREDYFLRIFYNLIESTKGPSRRMSLIYGFTYGLANCISFFGFAVAFYYGSILVNNKEMQFFEVFRVFAALIYGSVLIGRQNSFGADYTKAKLAGARILTLIKKIKPKIDVRTTDGIKLEGFKGSYSFANVSYNYPSRQTVKVLDGLDIVINPGETVAIVGSSGCGKSTSIKLIERFYDVTAGNLLIDGNDVRTLNLQWYRSQLGIVSQEPTLFDCSIAENIAYGDNSRVVPMSDITQAAKDANIHNFITSLPQGYDTSVGEKGAQLSGGQKQRIAIARALVRCPKVLLLDEATSALDSESEKIVQEALDKASKDRTCIIIAHRLSTIQNCDKIAVINKGKIVEVGSHTQLLSTKGAYYRLHTAHSRAH